MRIFRLLQLALMLIYIAFAIILFITIEKKPKLASTSFMVTWICCLIISALEVFD